MESVIINCSSSLNWNKERGGSLVERRGKGKGGVRYAERERESLDDFGEKCGARLIREWNKSRSKPRLSRG